MKPFNIDRMSKTVQMLISLSLALNIFTLMLLLDGSLQLSSAKESSAVEAVAKDTAPQDDWGTFIEALAIIESGGNPAAVGKKNDVGLLQITPVVVREVNRILGREVYCNGDRTDPDKSIEMFNIIQDHYNSGHDMNLALKIWNSRAPLSYHTKVMAEYRRLLDEIPSTRE